jgi:hypothetical protein
VISGYVLTPFFIDRFIITPTLPSRKIVVVETVATFAGKITNIGYVKLKSIKMMFDH